MKYLITTIAALVLVGCGESDHQHSHDHGHSHAEGDHDHAESDGQDHDKELKAAETFAEAKKTKPAKADTSFFEAAFECNVEAVKQHLAAGTNVNAKDFMGDTALHNVVRMELKDFADRKKIGDVKDLEALKEIIELLIAAGANVNARGDTYPHHTPLDTTTTHLQPEAADLLRKHGGKTGDWFDAGESILIAARVGHVEAIKKHLADGADVNAKDKDNRFTALDEAIRHKKTEAADLLRKHGGKTAAWLDAGESILIAASAGHVEAIKKHLAAGADVNAHLSGFTALHKAAKEGHKEIVELLIANGGDVNVIGGSGITPLDYAIRYKKTEIADLLLKHGGKTCRELDAEGK